jgi:hypothetical protein
MTEKKKAYAPRQIADKELDEASGGGARVDKLPGVSAGEDPADTGIRFHVRGQIGRDD